MTLLYYFGAMNRLALFLPILCCFIAAGVQSSGNEISCDLFGLKVEQQSHAFGTEIEIVADCIGNGEWVSAALGPGEVRRMRVREIDGTRLSPSEVVEVLAFGKRAGDLKVGQSFRVKGALEDGFSFGSRVSLSLKVITHEHLESKLKDKPAPIAALVDLATSIGREVEIEGTLYSLNGVWWLSYGKDVYLTDAAGRSMTFETNWHGRIVRVRGLVKRQLRSSLDQISLKVARDLVMYSVIQDAMVSLKSASRTDEKQRFRALYPRTPQPVDGAFKLLPEESFRRNMMGHETTALLFYERNWPHVEYMVQQTAVPLDVIARRIHNTELPADLRLIYAGILAARGDSRGAEYLKSVIQSGEDEPEAGALYVLGAFRYWGPTTQDKQAAPWLEKLALHCLRVAPYEAITYSSIPQLLADLKSQPGIDRMVELLTNGVPAPPLHEFDSSYEIVNRSGSAVTFDSSSELLIPIISTGPELLSSDVLIKLAAVYTEPDYSRRLLFREMLARDDPRAVDLFFEDIGTSFWSMDLDSCNGPRVIEAFSERLPGVSDPKIHGVLTSFLTNKSHAAADKFAQQLLDPKTPISRLNALSWDLLQAKGGNRHAAKVVQVLQERVLPKQQTELDAMTVSRMINRIAGSSDPAAVEAMIGLLAADFSRLEDEWVSAREFRHLIAGCLAEMTGESFGTDAKAWQ